MWDQLALYTLAPVRPGMSFSRTEVFSVIATSPLVSRGSAVDKKLDLINLHEVLYKLEVFCRSENDQFLESQTVDGNKLRDGLLRVYVLE